MQKGRDYVKATNGDRFDVYFACVSLSYFLKNVKGYKIEKKSPTFCLAFSINI